MARAPPHLFMRGIDEASKGINDLRLKLSISLESGL